MQYAQDFASRRSNPNCAAVRFGTHALMPLLLAISVSQAYAISVFTTGPAGADGIGGISNGDAGTAGEAAPAWDATATVINDDYNWAYSTAGNGGRGGDGAYGVGSFMAGAAGAGGAGGPSTATAITSFGSGANAGAGASARGGYGGAAGKPGISNAASGAGANGGLGGSASGTARATSSNGLGYDTTAQLELYGGTGGAGNGVGSRGGDGGEAKAGPVSAVSTGGGDASAVVSVWGGLGGSAGSSGSAGGNGAAVALNNAATVATTGTANYAMTAIAGEGGDAAGAGQTAGIGGAAFVSHTLNDTAARRLRLRESATGGSGGGAYDSASLGNSGGDATTFADISGVGSIDMKVTATGGKVGGPGGAVTTVARAGNASVIASAVTTYGSVTLSGEAAGGDSTAFLGQGAVSGGTATISLFAASGNGGAVYVDAYSSQGHGGGALHGDGANGLNSILSNAVRGSTSGALTLSQQAIGGSGGDAGDATLSSRGSVGGNGGLARSDLTLNDTLASSVTARLIATGGDAGSATTATGISGLNGAAQTHLDLNTVGQGQGFLESYGRGANSWAQVVGATVALTVYSVDEHDHDGSATAYGNARATNGAAITTVNAEAHDKSVATATAIASGLSGSAATRSAAYADIQYPGDIWVGVVARANGEASPAGVTATSVATWSRSVPDLINLGSSMALGNSFSNVAGVPVAADVSAAIANHANATAAMNGGTALGVGALGVMAAGGSSATYSSSAELTFRFSNAGTLSLSLLDGLAAGTDAYGSLTFSVMANGVALVSRSFSTELDALAYFNDQSILLGDFNGVVDLTLSVSMTSDVSGQGFAGSYLLSVAPLEPSLPAIPEPASWATMLLGLAALIGRQRRKQAEAGISHIEGAANR
ncbi:MAG TPA: PEP-CTERM sorting domain-containing protein [Burkholderiaceae bacterium]|jgi:hypothetical protein